MVAFIGLSVVAAFAINSVRTSSPGGSSRAPAPAVAERDPTPDAAPAPAVQQPERRDTEAPAGTSLAQQDRQQQDRAAPEPTPDPAPTGEARGLRARTFPTPDAFTPIGAVDPDGPDRALIEFTDYGAGVEAITLTDYFNDHHRRAGDHYAVQRRVSRPRFSMTGAPLPPVTVASLASAGVEIEVAGGPAEFVDLRVGAEGSLWRETAPGAFEAIIEDDAGVEVARVEKRYVLPPGEITLRVEQRLVNLTDERLRVVWYQYGPVDLPMDVTGYGLDVRRIRFGHLLTPAIDPSRSFVQADNDLIGRATLINKRRAMDGLVWPLGSLGEPGEDLVWVAMTSRYFAFAVHPLLNADAVRSGAPVDKRLRLAEAVHRVVIGPVDHKGNHILTDSSVIAQLTSERMEVAPNGSLDLSFGAYAGPILGRVIREDPVRAALGLDKLVVYNLGGMCAPCTFQWLARPLIRLLLFLHDYILFDWALAIIGLVLIVRTILHPVTRRSQIAMLRFSKQMQGLAPKQQKLREKFKDDPKRMQQEMAKLMREEGVSFTGMLGCLPMFLQTPIWIALYAALFFAFELRHQQAFFGFFQWVSGGRWSFLADLSAPDNFIEFGRTLINIPLYGPVNSFNILPILLGVVFFLQQKYLTPPTTTQLTPEQAQQQKIMKIMLVVMFPIFMFNAPSGLALYFIANSTLGIFESRWIRAHVDKSELEIKKPRPTGDDRKRVRNRASSRDPFARKREEKPGASFKRRDHKKK
ncbi:MAG: membrane protein insertase YidC [Phycisphaerales bacterium]|nr:MAG: membrane protein insertase YidC [Phycisphaerales bacterium]